MINFPNSPSQGQVFTSTTGLQYVYIDGVWRIVEAPQDIGKAESRNRIVNGAMQISQEWVNTAGGPLGAIAFYAADQWVGATSSAAGTAAFQRVQSVTPNGSANRVRLTTPVADTALAATEYISIVQSIEGIRVADFKWGTASARQAVLRFGFKAPAGTYAVSIANGAVNRTYIANFTISAGQANTDTEQTLIIPGDATGTWLTDTGIGMIFRVNVAAGSSYLGVAGWQAGNLTSIAGNTNGWATAGNTFELFDVGLYLDPLNTGIAPPWQMPDEAEELRACRRYYAKYDANFTAGGVATGNQTFYSNFTYPVRARIAPALGSIGYSASNCSGAYALINVDGLRFDTVSTAGGGFYLIVPTVVVNARM